jgi:anti-sigma regulatory factor (Ser/Thr protein kinase)
MVMQREFEAKPLSARAVRRFVEESIPGAARLDDVVLAASELAANVIRHANTAFTVRLIATENLVRVEVSDGSSIIPAIEDLTESQRGLRLIEAISEDWGFRTTDNGKTVWAEFRNTS